MGAVRGLMSRKGGCVVETDQQGKVKATFAGTLGHLDQVNGRPGLSFRMNGDVAVGIDAEISAAPTVDAVHTHGVLNFPFFRQIGHEAILTRKRQDKSTIPRILAGAENQLRMNKWRVMRSRCRFLD